uniref:Uncharacterized protein n=1 Tax=Trieres chinensis TaxID=1514140 RepID=A0A7S2EGJ5_TRICV|mmetsp:Transcript_21932/g.44371  ORF Transcript_21932/g.44371 Transcript_21932/m.44371 type:complete len:224 (+) Transcript_21932:32-703(+)
MAPILLLAFLLGTANAFVSPGARAGYLVSPHHSRELVTSSDGRRLCRSIEISSSVARRLTAQDVIESGVSFDTFAPQFLWLLMIAAPSSTLTKRVMGPLQPILALACVHFAIVVTAAAQEGALSQVLIFTEVFDPSLSQLAGMQKLFAYPNFVAEEWPHVLIWDLFVGRAIWLDGLERGINTRLALAFCNFIGPPGLLIHAATCVITKKGLPSMGFGDNVRAD